ncbi:MAG TPA: FAD-binding oxidoreductase [Acidimicrobiales bacterium]|nr:FAD-binding oxidoreductase [Acidimicrobiales bacterium]
MAQSVLNALQAAVTGEVIGAQDPGYDEARAVYNGMIDKRPGAVVRCTNVSDVAAAVKVARDEGLDLSIRGGGHSAPGFGTNDGGVVLDLNPFQEISVDPERRTVKAGGGCTWKIFNDATYEYGLATTGGIIGSTGIAGLTLGGGIGYLSRRYGLSCDNLVSAEVVLADGSVVIASEKENDDLFWALRGGGGNFGVVTTFEYRLHPVAEIYGGPIVYPVDRAEDLVKFYREYIAEAPEDLGGFLGFHLAPPLPFLPESWHFRNVCLAVTCWTGPIEEGEKMIQPFLDAVEPVGSHVGPMPYPALNVAFDELLPKGLQHYWKASFARELSDGAAKIHAEYGAKVPAIQTAVHLYPINGAVQRVGAEETAFAYRDVSFSPVIAGMWDNPADNEQNIAWVRAYFEALRPYSIEGGYVNFMDEDDQGRVKANYKGNYGRLAAVKAKYDPGNLFHLNQNIRPVP